MGNKIVLFSSKIIKKFKEMYSPKMKEARSALLGCDSKGVVVKVVPLYKTGGCEYMPSSGAPAVAVAASRILAKGLIVCGVVNVCSRFRSSYMSGENWSEWTRPDGSAFCVVVYRGKIERVQYLNENRDVKKLKFKTFIKRKEVKKNGKHISKSRRVSEPVKGKKY